MPTTSATSKNLRAKDWIQKRLHKLKQELDSDEIMNNLSQKIQRGDKKRSPTSIMTNNGFAKEITSEDRLMLSTTPQSPSASKLSKLLSLKEKHVTMMKEIENHKNQFEKSEENTLSTPKLLKPLTNSVNAQPFETQLMRTNNGRRAANQFHDIVENSMLTPGLSNSPPSQPSFQTPHPYLPSYLFQPSTQTQTVTPSPTKSADSLQIDVKSPTNSQNTELTSSQHQQPSHNQSSSSFLPLPPSFVTSLNDIFAKIKSDIQELQQKISQSQSSSLNSYTSPSFQQALLDDISKKVKQLEENFLLLKQNTEKDVSELKQHYQFIESFQTTINPRFESLRNDMDILSNKIDALQSSVSSSQPSKPSSLQDLSPTIVTEIKSMILSNSQLPETLNQMPLSFVNELKVFIQESIQKNHNTNTSDSITDSLRTELKGDLEVVKLNMEQLITEKLKSFDTVKKKTAKK